MRVLSAPIWLPSAPTLSLRPAACSWPAVICCVTAPTRPARPSTSWLAPSACPKRASSAPMREVSPASSGRSPAVALLEPCDRGRQVAEPGLQLGELPRHRLARAAAAAASRNRSLQLIDPGRQLPHLRPGRTRLDRVQALLQGGIGGFERLDLRP